MGSIILVLFSALAAGAGYVFARDALRRRRGGGTRVTDDVLRQIEEQGRVELDDPLDLDEINDEEQRFWGEPWDEPDEW